MEILDKLEQNIRTARAGYKVDAHCFYRMEGDLFEVSITLIEIIRRLEERIENLERAASAHTGVYQLLNPNVVGG